MPQFSEDQFMRLMEMLYQQQPKKNGGTTTILLWVLSLLTAITTALGAWNLQKTTELLITVGINGNRISRIETTIDEHLKRGGGP